MILVFRARPPVGLAVQVSLRREVPGLHSFKVPRASVTLNVRRAPGAGSAVALDQYACRRGVVVGSRFSRALDRGTFREASRPSGSADDSWSKRFELAAGTCESAWVAVGRARSVTA
jgi:hypothetical protein